MWQPVANIPTDGTLVDLCLYSENEDLFYRIVDAFFDQKSGWKYRDEAKNIYTIWQIDRKIVAWMYPVAPPDIELINIPIDTPVVATGIDGVSFNAHFAGTDELGNPLVWVNGKTSFTETVKYECESVKKFTNTSQENK